MRLVHNLNPSEKLPKTIQLRPSANGISASTAAICFKGLERTIPPERKTHRVLKLIYQFGGHVFGDVVDACVVVESGDGAIDRGRSTLPAAERARPA